MFDRSSGRSWASYLQGHLVKRFESVGINLGIYQWSVVVIRFTHHSGEFRSPTGPGKGLVKCPTAMVLKTDRWNAT